MKKTVLALTLLAASANAAEPILGSWTTQSGETVIAQRCAGNYCLNVQTGKYAGQQIGELRGSGTHYTGMVTDPADSKTYTGSATVTGPTLKLTGCVLKFLCKSQTWIRQP